VTETVIQSSFNSGEWSPKLFARVDITKYRSGAALLENFFVDYRGGASTRPGTKYILQAYKSATSVRLIPFQASSTVGYVLEFGDGYIRFFYQGSPVLETATSLTSAAAGPPEVFTDNAHGYANNDWVFIQNKYYIIANITTNTFTLTDLFGNAINTNPFSLPAAPQRVYTIASPYAAADLALVKFAQNVTQMILCHPSYAPQVLTIISATSWNILPITIGSTAATPGVITISNTLAAGTVAWAYVVTAIDGNGNESSPSAQGLVSSSQDLRTTVGTVALSWPVVAGAVGYNVYKCDVSYFNSLPTTPSFGFIGSTVFRNFHDTNISPDFRHNATDLQEPIRGQGCSFGNSHR
jgi:hypothetical protein